VALSCVVSCRSVSCRWKGTGHMVPQAGCCCTLSPPAAAERHPVQQRRRRRGGKVRRVQAPVRFRSYGHTHPPNTAVRVVRTAPRAQLDLLRRRVWLARRSRSPARRPTPEGLDRWITIRIISFRRSQTQSQPDSWVLTLTPATE
jgi:hypothetical protein